jgi:hypothetical protein
LGDRRGNSAEQVEQQELRMAEPVFNVVSEDPEVEHVAAEVQPTTMHEHRGEDCYEIATWVCGQAAWNYRPPLDEWLAAA